MRRLWSAFLAMVCGGEYAYDLDTRPPQLDIDSFSEFVTTEDEDPRHLSSDTAYASVREELTRRRMSGLVISREQFEREHKELLQEKLREQRGVEAKPLRVVVSDFTRLVEVVMLTSWFDPPGMTVDIPGHHFDCTVMVGNGKIHHVFRRAA